MPDAAVDTAPEAEVPSKVLSRLPDAWIRVCVGLKGIKSIYKIALDGAASNKVAVAMPATASNFKPVVVMFIFVMNSMKDYLHVSCGVGCS